MNGGDFFGSVFKALGILVMAASVLFGVAILAYPETPGHEHSVALIGVMLFLLAIMPFLAGSWLHRLGKRLQSKPQELPGAFTRESDQAQWGEQAPAPTPRPAPLQAVRPRPRAPRIAAPEVDVEVAPDSVPAPEKKIIPRGKKKYDPTAMGVDELYDPDKDT